MKFTTISLLLPAINSYLETTHNYLELFQFISKCNFLLGIGSGGTPESSGECEALQKILSMLPDKIIIFDVGANRGQYASLLIKNSKEKELSLHCFEPSKKAFSMLEETLHQYTISNKRIYNFAMGEIQEERTLWADAPGSALASFTKRRLDHFSIDFSHHEQIHVETIDAYCEKNSIDHIHLLKIDTEGHELNVLAGAKTMFTSSAIDFVQFEFGGCNIDTRTFIQDFFYFFNEFGFTLHLITPSGFCMPMLKYNETYEKFLTTNFIAVSSRFIPF